MRDHNHYEELRRHYTVSYEQFSVRYPDRTLPIPHKHALVFPLTNTELLHAKDNTKIDRIPERFTGRINPNVDESTTPLAYMPEIELLFLSMLVCSLELQDEKNKNIQFEVRNYWNELFTVFEICVDEIKQSTCPLIMDYRKSYFNYTFIYLIPIADVNYRKSRFHSYPQVWAIFATIFGPRYNDLQSFYCGGGIDKTPQDATEEFLSPSPQPGHSPRPNPSLPPPPQRLIAHSTYKNKSDERTLPQVPVEVVRRLESVTRVDPDPIPSSHVVVEERPRTYHEDVWSGMMAHNPSPPTPAADSTPERRETPITLIPRRISPTGVTLSGSNAHVGDMPATQICDTVSSLLLETPSADTDELIFPHM